MLLQVLGQQRTLSAKVVLAGSARPDAHRPFHVTSAHAACAHLECPGADLAD